MPLRSASAILRRSSTGRSTFSILSICICLTLRLLGRALVDADVRPVAEAADRLLQARDLLLLGDVALLLALELDLAGDGVGGVRAGPDPHAAVVELRDRRDALVEQVAVVGDHQHRAVEAGHEPLELVAPAHVEVRLGLVEQQHVGAAREARGERDELALAAAELAGRPLERGVGEAEVAQVRAGLALHAVAAELGPAGEQPLLARERARHRVQVGGERGVGEAALGRVQLGLELGDLRARREHRRQRGALVARDLLRAGRRARARGGARPRRRRGARGPARIRSSVDLPPPLGPSTPMRAPAASSRSSPSSTRRPPKVFARPRAERRGTLAMSRPASGGAENRGKAGSTRIHGRVTSHPHPRERPRGPRAGRPRRRRRARPARARRRARVARRAPRRAARSCPDSVRWVQLPSAGVEQWVRAGQGRRRPGLDVGHRRLRAAGRRARAGADAGRRQGDPRTSRASDLGRRGPPRGPLARGLDAC